MSKMKNVFFEKIFRCYQGAPTVVSSPHFYQSPSFLAEDFQACVEIYRVTGNECDF